MTTLCSIVTPVIATAYSDPEAALLRRWRDHRDQAALADLANRLTEPGWRAARAFAGNQAEDVLQDAFLALTTGAEHWRGGAVRSWFVAIVANTARAYHRRRRLSPMPAQLPMSESPAEPELGERALAAVADLPDHERVPLWLNVVEGLECQDIASQLGRSPGTVRAQVTRGLCRLRQMLGSATTPAVITIALANSARAIEVPTSLADTLTNKAATALPVTPFIVPLMVKIVVALLLITGGVLVLRWWHYQPTALSVTSFADPPSPPAPVSDRVRVVGEGQFVHANPIESIALHPSAERIATGQQQGDIIIWDIASAREVRRIDVSDPTYKTKWLSPNGAIDGPGPDTAFDIKWLDHHRLLAVVGAYRQAENYVGVWNADTGVLERIIPLGLVDARTCAVVDAGTKLLVPGKPSLKNPEQWSGLLPTQSVSVFDLRTGAQLESFVNVAPLEPKCEWRVKAIVPGSDGRIACLSYMSESSGAKHSPHDLALSVWSLAERRCLADKRIANEGAVWRSTAMQEVT